jgi:anthranilate phosphoribosyltransferase
MKPCEVCGNVYDRPFQITIEGTTHVFDSFECAIHALAPTCAHCGCKIVGHGAQSGSTLFCCAHCAKAVGVAGIDDRT